MLTARRFAIAVAFVVATTFGFVLPATAQAAPTRACGTTLSDAAVRQIVQLSDTSRYSSDPTLVQLNKRVADLWTIADILVAHKDRRGLFVVGLAATERDAVMPLQNRAGFFADPAWAQAISLNLLDRFLDALRAEFTGGSVPSQWRTYFDLAADCSVTGERVALVGYNSHITVDLAYAAAHTKTTPDNAKDFFTIVDQIAAHGNSIVSITNAKYGVDLGPTFRFYFFGEGLDALVGAGKATGPMLRAADVGYNVITFGNGLALQNPDARSVAAADIVALWSTANAALFALEELRVFS